MTQHDFLIVCIRQTLPNPPPTTAAGRFAYAMSLLQSLVMQLGNLRGPQADFVVQVCMRLQRLRLRFGSLMEKFQSGTLPKPQALRPHAPRPAKPRNQAHRLPTRFAWLPQWIQITTYPRGDIESLLENAEVKALIAATPQAGRILRPICHMLGIAPPAILERPKPGPVSAPPPPKSPRNPPRPSASLWPRVPHPYKSMLQLSHLWGAWPPRKTA